MNSPARSFAALSLLAFVACGAPGTDDVTADESSLTGVGSLPVGTALVARTNVNLRSGPSTSNAVIHVIPKGTTVTVQDSQPANGYYHVSDDRGARGWTAGAYYDVSSSALDAGAADAGPGNDAGTTLDAATVADASASATVFLIVMENHNWRDIHGSASAPYINGTLLSIGAHAERYMNPPGLHPSEPNYIWLEAGDALGITDDNGVATNHRSSTHHLVNQIEAAGLGWKSYQEDIDGMTCALFGVRNYASRHNPFVYFDDVTNGNDPHAPRCIKHVRPHAELATDLAADHVAAYNFITPNLCNDMHDSCAPRNNPIAQGDAWLAAEIPKIMGSAAYQRNGVILITWDEGEPGDGPIGLIALSHRARPGYAGSMAYTHSSTLKTVQELLAVGPLLGGAAKAGTNDLSDLFTTSP